MGAANSKIRASSLRILRTLSGGKFRGGSSKYGTSSSVSLENLSGGGSKSSKSNYSRQGSSASKPKSESVRYKTKWPYPHVEKDFLPVYNMRSENQKDFTISHVIASGAYGNVLKGYENKTKRSVAIKVIDKSRVLSEGPGAIQQCKDEVIIQSELPKSQYIVELVAFWQTRNRLYLVLEHIPNGELFDLWKSVRIFSDSLARFYITQITTALDFLHRNNVMYRDLKMENILLDTRACVKLIDFGLSKQLRQGDKTSTTCGTLQYTAPEVLRGDAYGHEADWWSMGILGFALLAGKFPVFGARNHVEMRNMVAGHQYRMPLHFSNEASDLLTMLLQKNVENRLQSVSQLFNHRYYHNLLTDSTRLELELFVTRPDVDKLPESFPLRNYFRDALLYTTTDMSHAPIHTTTKNHNTSYNKPTIINNTYHHDNQTPTASSYRTTTTEPSTTDDNVSSSNCSDYAEPIWTMTSGLGPSPSPLAAAATDTQQPIKQQQQQAPPPTQLRPIQNPVAKPLPRFNNEHHHRWSQFDLPHNTAASQPQSTSVMQAAGLLSGTGSVANVTKQPRENGVLYTRDITTPLTYHNFKERQHQQQFQKTPQQEQVPLFTTTNNNNPNPGQPNFYMNIEPGAPSTHHHNRHSYIPQSNPSDALFYDNNVNNRPVLLQHRSRNV